MFSRVVSTCARSCLIAITIGACDTDEPTAASIPIIERVSGDRQIAPPGSSLERPLVARIHDRHGRPVRHAKVWWTADAGQLTAVSTTTDAYGKVTAAWQLGTDAPVQRATVYANGVDSIAFVAFVDGNALPDRVALRTIDFETYEGSGQVVHPDIAIGPFEGLDDSSRMVITPYPGSNPNFENPSLFVRSGRAGWRVPEGVTNPLVTPTKGYLSDPDIVWLDDTREFRLFYRRVDTENEIGVLRSTDGVRWSEPSVVVHAPNHEAISPSVVRRGPNDWSMWTVNSGLYGCTGASTTVDVRRSSDGEVRSAPTPVSLVQPGMFPWHIEVQWIPSRGEYWALFNAKFAGSCTTDVLYFATSPDGLTWRTFQSPVIRRGMIPEFADVVYRATFAYDEKRDAISIWHSGARSISGVYEWHAAFERLRRTDLLDRVDRPDAAARSPSDAPPLTNATAP